MDFNTSIVRILWAILVIALGYIVITILDNFFFKKLRDFRKFDEGTANFVQRLTKIFSWVVIGLIVLGIIGINLGPFLASLGIAGFVLGFALKDVLANLAAGVMIMVHKPFLVGDYIDVGKDIRGTVKDIGISAIEIKTFKNEKIIVPNSSVWGNPIINYSAYPTRRIAESVLISYGSSIDKATKIILKIFDDNPKVLDEPGHSVVISDIGSDGIKLSARAWVKNSDYWSTVYKIRKELKATLEKAGITIPFKQLDVHMN